MLTDFELVLYGLVVFATSIFSGIAGAGGGFITTPLLIILGLSPAQAVSTNKMNGLSLSIGALSGMRRRPERSKRLIAVIMLLALVTGLIAPKIIVELDGDIYRNILGTILLLMIPFLIWKNVGLKKKITTRRHEILGLVLLGFWLILQGIFSSGLGSFVTLTLMTFFGMSSIDANVTKRISQVTLNIVIILSLFSSGLIIWKVALTGLVAAGIGGFIGGKIAVKKGNKFVMSVFLIFMFISGITLLIG